MKNLFRAITLAGIMVLVVACAPKKDVNPDLLDTPGYTRTDNNLHQIDGPPPGTEDAFRLYRSGAPPQETFAKWCKELGIKRAIVMSGDAEEYELAYQDEGICPGVEVIYNVKQDHNQPVSDGFLKWFDKQIEKARQDKVGILFRCYTGSHRAGRLAAYYQMKYQGLNSDEAIAVMTHKGMMMSLFNIVLIPQVRAMEDYIQGRPCGEIERMCVEKNSDKWMPKDRGL
ncbi:MAG: hypothetical protein R6V10_12180 [bacterium]